jgi:hypothetical protein
MPGALDDVGLIFLIKMLLVTRYRKVKLPKLENHLDEEEHASGNRKNGKTSKYPLQNFFFTRVFVKKSVCKLIVNEKGRIIKAFFI